MVFINLIPYVSIVLFAYFILSKRIVIGLNAKGRNKSYSVFIVMLILCIFAGLRSAEIGTDTSHYLDLYVRAISIDGFNSYYQKMFNGRDLLFAFLSFGLAKLTNANQFVFLFSCQFLATWPIFIAMKKMKTYSSISVGFLFFFVLYFPICFNTMREAIAGAFLLLALINYYNCEYKKCIILAIVAQQFHHATILAIFIMLVVELVIAIQNKQIRRLISGLVIVIIIVCALNSTAVFGYLFSDGALFGNSKIASYYTRYTTGTLKTYLITMDKYGERELAFRLIYFTTAILLSRRIDMKNDLSKDNGHYFTQRFQMYSVVSIIMYVVIFIATSSTYGYRFTYYLDLLNIFYYTRIIKRSNSAIKYLLLLLLVAYFYLIYVQTSAHGIFPYRIA